MTAAVVPTLRRDAVNSGKCDGEQALAAFCQAEHFRLVGALTVYCGDAEVAAELAQEALARACKSWSRVSAMEAPGAWVHRVGINLANSHFARRRAERLARLTLQSRQAAQHLDADTPDCIAVRRAVAALPKRQRTALVLRYYTDLPIHEVAELMGCAPGTVKALTSQALAALRGSSGLADLEAPDVA